MSNSFHTPLSDLVAGTTARADDVNDKFDAVETAFDNVESETDLAIKLPDGTAGNQQISESAANRASKEIGFDASGDLVLISSAFTWQGDWATSTAYLKNDVVRDSSSKNLYAVTADYTSGASVSADVTAGSLSMAINVEDVETAKSAAETAQTAAETAETNAETAETNAAASETNAAASETNAAASETAAAASETNASASASAAAASYDAFDDRYLGTAETDPTTDNDGGSLAVGTLYFNTTSDLMKVYTGSAWVVAYASADGAMLGANNLADVDSVSAAVTNLGLDSASSVQADNDFSISLL